MSTPQIKNSVGMAVTSVASAGVGTITLGAALSGGYQTAATAYGANANIDIRIEEGDTWEICRDCTYTHSGTTVTRGTLEDGSSGTSTRVAFTSAAKVYVVNAGYRIQLLNEAATLGFRARADGTNTQNITTGAGTALIHGGSGGALKTVDWNNGSYFTQSSGIFFPKAGTWLIGASAVAGTIADGKFVAVYISHSTDGSTWSDNSEKAGIAWRGASSAAGLSIGGSGTIIVNANGTTDRWALRLFHNDAGTPIVPGSAAAIGWCVFFAKYLGE